MNTSNKAEGNQVMQIEPVKVILKIVLILLLCLNLNTNVYRITNKPSGQVPPCRRMQ